MNNFDFYNPTQILFGQGQIAALSKLVPATARVLLVYGGGSILHNGAHQEVTAALAGRYVSEFSGVEPNPSYETLMRAIEQVRTERIDFLLAVGGGSVIDGTKFIAAGALHADDPWTILEKGGGNVIDALPFGAILTLPATGSEMNATCVITRKSSQQKRPFMSRKVFPRFSILDPSKTLSLPPRQIGNGVVDAFAHVIEQYLTYPVDAKVQDRFAEGLLSTLIEEGPQALADPGNYAVRANIMWCATLALNGLIGAGVPQDWSTHMIGHELTALYDLDHAQTLAIVLPGMLNARKDAKRAKLLQFAERVWDIRDGDDEARMNAAIERTEAFFVQMGLSTRLSDYGLGAEQIEAVMANLERDGRTKLGEHRDISLDVSRAVLEARL